MRVPNQYIRIVYIHDGTEDAIYVTNVPVDLDKPFPIAVKKALDEAASMFKHSLARDIVDAGS